MSEIIKTEAIVLGKINYSESSLIVSLFTKSNGKISAILKGGRRPKSKLASIVDVLNNIEVIVYKKESRDVQIISSADLVSHYPKIKSDLATSIYAYAVCELVKELSIENENNELLFKGLKKILNLIENKEEHPGVLFGRFFIFFLKEIGYELNLENCEICSKQLTIESRPTRFSSEGFICNQCKIEGNISKTNESELFNYLYCLKNRKKIFSISHNLIGDGNKFLLNYLRNHVETFKGLNSLEMI